MTHRRHLILATGNAHKAREMAAALAGCGWTISAAPGDVADVPETGETFRENARLKALAVAEALGVAALADDSGLAVDALNGGPGVHSKRWAGDNATDADRVAHLLSAMHNVPQGGRTARFVCAVCIAEPGGVLWEGEGTVEGVITDAPRGENGFGYDPVFQPQGGDRTMAERTQEEKNAISHRGRAIAAARAWLLDKQPKQDIA